jgi:ferric-dicitrate binding protein FerR (iron transport regulator)
MPHLIKIVERRSTKDLARIVATKPKGYDERFLQLAAIELQRRRRARRLLLAFLGAAGLVAAALWLATGNTGLALVVLIGVSFTGLLLWLMDAIPEGNPMPPGDMGLGD